MSEQADQYMAALGYLPRGKVASKFDRARGERLKALYSTVGVKKPKKSELDAVLGSMTVKVGIPGVATMDTGIEYNKDVAAFMVGVGDQLGDSVRGIKQILTENGIVDKDSMLGIDAETQDANEELLRKLYADPEYGTAAMSGAVVGALAEPVGLLLPATKAKHLGKAFAYAAVMGGMYGSSLYVDGEESRMKNAALGALLGGPAGALLSRFSRQAIGGDLDNAIQANSKPHIKYVGIDKKTGKPRYRVVERNNDPMEVMADLEARAALEGPKASLLGKTKELVDQAIQPIYDNVKKISPKIAARMRRMDAEQHTMSKRWTDSTHGFNEWTKSLTIAQMRDLHKLLLNGIDKATIDYVAKIGKGEGVQHLRAIEKTMKEVLKAYKEAGYRVNERANYFPTAVRDLNGLRREYQSDIDKVLKKLKAKKGRPLTEAEKSHAIERLVTFDARFLNTSGSLKKRKVQEVADEKIMFYHDPVTALHYYISTAAEDISKRRFFKHFGYKPKGDKGLDVTGADLTESINHIADAFQKEGLTPDQQNKLVKLLSSRMDSKVHNTHKGIQALKNLSYASTLGNYWSALTQIGDIVFAFHKYGIKASVQSIFGKNITTKEAMGIDKAMLELNSARSITSKVADWAFKYGGFDALDRFGKNVNLNASLRKNKSLVLKKPKEFKKKWKDVFGDEIDNVMEDLRNMKLSKDEYLTDNVRLMLWNDLADTQPIGLSEMPKKYLDMPNGRVLYAYKTFSLKQFQYMRNILNKEKNPLKKAADLTYFATLFVVANAGIDTIKDFKDFMDGKDLKVGDKVWDNTLALIGTSKYAADKSRGIQGIIEQMVTPVPVKQALDVVGEVTSGTMTTGKAINRLPVVGKINKEFGLVK